MKSLILTAEKTDVTVGGRTPLYVTEVYADGGKNFTHNVTWEISPPLSARVDKAGIFDAKVAGTTTIVALQGGLRSNAVQIQISEQAAPQSSSVSPTLQRIAVTYVKNNPSPNAGSSLPTANFTATGYYSDGSTATVTNDVQWNVSGTAGGAVTQSGYYQPKTRGTDTVSATRDGINGSTSISIP